MSKTVVKNSIRYFELLLDEMRTEWKAGTKVQRESIERKAEFVQVLRKDAIVRLTCLNAEVAKS